MVSHGLNQMVFASISGYARPRKAIKYHIPDKFKP